MKSFDIDVIKNEILNGLLQVDSSFSINEFSCYFSKNTRKLTVDFTAQNLDGDNVEVNDIWLD